MTIDHKICWKPHIQHVQAKVSRSISVLSKAKYLLNSKALHIVYCSLILPYLNYCVEVWGNTYKSSLLPLCTLQKRAIRMVHKAGFQDHTNQLFINSCLLKLPDLVEFQTAQLMYKARNKQLPDNIQKLFTDREGGYDYRGNLNFRTRIVRTTMKRMCTSVSGVKVWNKLSQELKQCPSMSVFKKRLRLMIFNKYRDDDLNGCL